MKPTEEQILQWAREAGLLVETSDGWDVFMADNLDAAMVLAYEAGRKDENEEIAVEFDKRHEAVKHRNNYFLS